MENDKILRYRKYRAEGLLRRIENLYQDFNDLCDEMEDDLENIPTHEKEYDQTKAIGGALRQAQFGVREAQKVLKVTRDFIRNEISWKTASAVLEKWVKNPKQWRS